MHAIKSAFYLSVKRKIKKLHHKNKKGDDYPPNKGNFQMDAKVTNQYITHPTERKLLHKS
jgi:hypothetical protein